MSLAHEARRAAALLLEQEYVRIAARSMDGDALAAAGILALALEREGVDFHFSSIPDLTPRELARLRDERNETLVLVDLPALDAKDSLSLAGNVVLLHDADGAPVPDDAIAVTAARAGLAGGEESSASALAYAVALSLSQRNGDLAALAVGGALAEGQHAGGLRGLPAEYLAEAIEKGALAREPGLTLKGATVLEAVAQGVEPWFAGLAGRARVAKKLLADAGLPESDAPESLGPKEAERVASALATRLLESGAPEGALDALALPRYRAVSGPLAGETTADLARRCRAVAAGGGSGVALAWLWDRAHAEPAIASAERSLAERALAALLRAERSLAEPAPAGSPLVIEAPDAPSARALADLAALSLAPEDRPVVAWALESEESVVLAARASRSSAARGFDLGAATRAAAAALGGLASGNRVSAIARAPAPSRAALLAALGAAATAQPAPRAEARA